MSHLEREDPELYAAIEGERRRQVEKIELIASENYTSPSVMEATGSVLTNKYAEVYPGRRYYGGGGWDLTRHRAPIPRALGSLSPPHSRRQPPATVPADNPAH